MAIRWRAGSRLSLKITLLVVVFLIVTFSVVTPIIIGTVTSQAKQSLVNQSKSFASQSTRPIGDVFLLYQDSGLVRLRQQVQQIIEINTIVANVAVADTSGAIRYQHNDTPITVTEEEATSFEPLYEFDQDGFTSRVIYPFKEQSGAHRFTMIYAINSNETKAILSSLQNNILLSGTMITILAGSALVIFIEFLFVVPLKRMTQLAAAISAGDYGQTIELKSRDEINQLGNALNTMSARLKENITALKKAEEMKSEFLIISSHNFRTPLTVITGYIDLLKDIPLDPKIKQYIKTIEIYAQQLTELTNDMLTVAELEGQDRPTVSLEAIDLIKLLEDLVPTISDRLIAKEQVLQTDLGDHPINIRVQMTYLQTALWNLLDNASKFTPPKGIISLRVHHLPHEVQIEVQDTGIGIPEAEKQHLFTKFHRGTSLMKYEYEGVGLGLYMTKLMLEYMGASISVVSAEGEGSTFTIHLPMSTQVPSTPQAIPISRSGSLKSTGQ